MEIRYIAGLAVWSIFIGPVMDFNNQLPSNTRDNEQLKKQLKQAPLKKDLPLNPPPLNKIK